MSKTKKLGQITDIHHNKWDISVIEKGLAHPLQKKVCFRHVVDKKGDPINNYGYVDFYITKGGPTGHIQVLSGRWSNSTHHTSTLSLAILKQMIEIAEKELLQ